MKKLSPPPIIVLMLLSAMFFTASCKKKETAVPEKTTLQKLQYKWKVVTTVQNQYYSNTDHITTTTGAAGDYYDFNIDGKLYTNDSANGNVSFPYSLTFYPATRENALEWSDAGLFTIKILTDHALKLYSKIITDTNNGDFIETTITLSR